VFDVNIVERALEQIVRENHAGDFFACNVMTRFGAEKAPLRTRCIN